MLAWCPEAPHLYKKDGWYYLMIAEGGTEHFHAVTIARSREVMGDYEGYDGNPIMTHRHLGMGAPIANTGHADIVELKDGSWYMVMLASRPYGGYHKNMGRETFIAPMVWENGWPVVCPGTGKLDWAYPAPNLPEAPVEEIPETDDFDEKELAFCWNCLGTPGEGDFRLEDSCLKIRTTARPMEPTSPEVMEKIRSGMLSNVNCAGFVGRRQQHMSYTAVARMRFEPEESQTAGLILLQNNYHSLKAEMTCEKGKRILRVVKGYLTQEAEVTYHNVDTPYQKEICGEREWNSDTVTLELKAEGQKNTFTAVEEDGTRHVLASELDGGFLGSETAGGFVGAYVGMFASGNGVEGTNFACFDSFTYRPES